MNQRLEKEREIAESDQKKHLCIQNMARLDKRKHLMLNQQSLDTAEAMSDEIEEYCEAVEEFNKDTRNQLSLWHL